MTLRKHVLLLCSLVLLPGCASTPARTVVSSKPFCRAVAPVCIDKDDVITEQSAKQIEGNNLGRERVCGRPKPCQKKDS